MFACLRPELLLSNVCLVLSQSLVQEKVSREILRRADLWAAKIQIHNKLALAYVAYSMERDPEPGLKRNLQPQGFGSEQLPVMFRRV